jgi:SulP family sulfate permease
LQIGPYRFDRGEFAGSLGDLGTLIPLSVALMVIADLSVTSVLLMVGLFYVASGVYYRLPVPVQPLKVVSAIAIAYPAKITLPIIAASGISFGVILLLLAITGLIDRLAKFFTKPIMRGIQLGLGFILIEKGIGFITARGLFIHAPEETLSVAGIPVNPVMGVMGVVLVLLLISNRRFPAALVIVASGLLIGVLLGALKGVRLTLGPMPMEIYTPGIDDYMNALLLLVIPQIPLTLGNAVMGTTDTCFALFGKGEATRRATYRGFATSMGLVNVLTGMVAGMPMCHGAGGLAAHYRFGARTGGSNIIIGTLFLIIALLFGKIGVSLLSSIPNAVLGVLLLFAGLELALLIRDVKEKSDFFVAFLIAGIGLATTNMGIAFLAGMLALSLIRRWDIKV